MPGTSKKVVVRTRLLIEERGDGEMFAAHLDALGLTAYGLTSDEASKNVKDLFNTWITQYRDLGVLETRLDAIGAEWSYLADYDGPEPVEDTGENPGLRKDRSRTANYSLAMAA